MLNIKQASEAVQQTIDRLISAGEAPMTLYEPYYYMMEAGGKRIRPSLCVMTCSFFRENWQEALLPAAGIEVFHNFTLVHDDIMDKSDFRRNRPTIHHRWNANTAILTGDVMMIKAAELFNELPAECYKKVMPVFLETGRKVCEGQQFDMDFETEERITLPAYMVMIRLKTAELLAASLKIGAMIGNAPDATAEALYRFGIHIGTAFQLRDDYLDVFADQSELGKPIGSDILNKKKTYLYLSALEKSDTQEKNYLTSLFLPESNPGSADVENVKQIYLRLGIPQLISEKISQQNDFALQQLINCGLSQDATGELTRFSEKMMGRTQ